MASKKELKAEVARLTEERECHLDLMRRCRDVLEQSLAEVHEREIGELVAHREAMLEWANRVLPVEQLLHGFAPPGSSVILEYVTPDAEESEDEDGA